MTGQFFISPTMFYHTYNFRAPTYSEIRASYFWRAKMVFGQCGYRQLVTNHSFLICRKITHALHSRASTYQTWAFLTSNSHFQDYLWLIVLKSLITAAKFYHNLNCLFQAPKTSNEAAYLTLLSSYSRGAFYF